MSLPITVIILAQRQTAVLAQVIGSVSWAAEILVLWSSDEKFPTELHFPQLKWHQFPSKITDFAQLRNQGIQQATQNWLFFVDSDEVVPDNFPTVFQNLLTTAATGAMVQRQDIFLGQKIKWGEVRGKHFLRLFRKDMGHFERTVHERAVVTGLVAALPVTLTHYAHASISSFWQKVVWYAQLEAQIRRQQHEKVSFISLLLWPSGKFLQNYFLKLGILDGWRGVIYAAMMSLHSFTLRALLYEAHT